MSSLKSGALLSLFSGFSFEGVQTVPQKRDTPVADTMSYDRYPAPSPAISELANAAPEVTAASVLKQAA